MNAPNFFKESQQTTRKTKKYPQKFLEKWLDIFNPWLARCEDDPNKPFCRACQCSLVNDRCHLQRHGGTIKHTRNLEMLLSQGEYAVRENLGIKQERRKYPQQRNKFNSLLFSADSAEADIVMNKGHGVKSEYVENTAFHFVQAESTPVDQYNEETVWKLGVKSADVQCDPIPTSSNVKKDQSRDSCKMTGNKKARLQLLRQIQKDKNDLMDSFRELSSVSQNQLPFPPKENDHVDLFFASVSSSVKALSPKSISETKMRVSQLICELEMRALTKTEASRAATTGTPAVIVSPDIRTVDNEYIVKQPVAAAAHETTQITKNCDGHYEVFS